MKTISQKIVSIILAITLFISLVPFGTLPVIAEAATQGQCGSSLWWQFDPSTDTLTISSDGQTEMWGYSLGNTPWYAFRELIKTVNADEGLTSVSNYAFFDCTSLITVNMPGVYKVADSAFEGCNSLRNVILSSSTSHYTTIGKNAFANCVSLNRIAIPFNNVTIEANAFYCCEKLNSLSISCTANIGDNAFAYCSQLSSIYMTDNGRPLSGTISKNAFSQVKAEVYYNYSYAITSQDNRFGGQFNYEKMTSGPIGYDASWKYDKATESLNISGEGKLFEYSGGSRLPWMEQNSSSYISNIKTITIEEGITELPSYAFEYMGKVESIKLPNTLLKLYPNAFNDCESLTEITIPPSVKYVDGASYWNRCPNLKDIYYVGTEQEWNEIYSLASWNSYRITPHFLVYHPVTQSCINEGYPAHYEFDGTANHTFYDLNKSIIQAPKPSLLDHSFSSTWSKDSNCHWHVCTSCGVAISDETNHTYDNSCDEICNVCGYERKITHIFSNKWSTDASAHWHECTVCRNAIQDMAPHSFSDAWAADNAHHWHQCVICGESTDTSNHIYDNACDAFCNVCGYERTTEHRYSATYAADDDSHWKICTVCGKETINNPHTWDSGIVAKSPTCTEAGIMTYTCLVCGKTKTATVPEKGHTIVDDEAVPVTCTANGMTAGTHCSECGQIFVAAETIIALGHSWDEGTITKSATCTEEGVKTYHCKNCNAIKTEPIEARGHLVVVDPAVPATCTEPGLTEGTHCDVCGVTFVAQENEAATGHQYNSATVEPTCTSEGYTLYTCSVCGDSYFDHIVPASGHNFGEWNNNEISHWHNCTICDETLDASAHIFDDDHDADCNICGYVKDVDSIISSIHVEKITLIENISGYRDGTSNRFVYILPEMLDMEVTLNDGTVLAMDKNSHAVIINSQYEYVRYSVDTSTWAAGHTYTVDAKLCDKAFSFEVEIIANPYSKLTIEQTDDLYLVFEKQDGTIERQRALYLDARMGDRGMVGGFLKTEKYEFPNAKFHYYEPTNGHVAYESNVYLTIGTMTSNTIDNCYWLKSQRVKNSFVFATVLYRWYDQNQNNHIFSGFNQSNYNLDDVITIASNALIKNKAVRYETINSLSYIIVKPDDVLFAVRYMFGITDADLTQYSLYDAKKPNEIKIVSLEGGYGPHETILTYNNGCWEMTFREQEVERSYDYIRFALDDTFTVQAIEFVNDTAHATNTEISIESKRAIVGKEFSVSVDLSNNEGLAYLKLGLDYDASAFELVSASNANLLKGTYTQSQQMDELPFVLQWMSADDSKEDGTIVTLTFRVKESAVSGNYTIALTVNEAYNEKFDDVAIFVKGGSVTVYDYMVGDFNNDGVINGKDGILCSQALAGWNVPYLAAAADVNGDGVFNGKDGILLSQYLAGWDVVLG